VRANDSGAQPNNDDQRRDAATQEHPATRLLPGTHARTVGHLAGRHYAPHSSDRCMSVSVGHGLN
jgi:hypothetical protein